MKGMGYLFYMLLLIACSGGTDPVVIPDPTPIPTPDPDPDPVTMVQLPEVTDCGFEAEATLFDGWTEIFNEDFDTNLAQWTPWRGGAFNQELQHYQEDQLFVENDYLYIRMAREGVTGRNNPFDETQRSFSFVSGRIESVEEFGPDLGEGKSTVRFSARLRLVEGHGLWPAWWSYNDPWPTQGEIDILEARGDTPFEFQSNFHYGQNVNEVQTDPVFNDFHYAHPEKLSDCFHLYELIWSENSFQILFDGDIIKEYDAATYTFVPSFFRKNHRLTLNLAVGGFFFNNLIESDIPDEAFVVVDWVKVHEQ